MPERDFPAQNNIPKFKDINPRIGVAYDAAGNGRTAIKASFSRNLAFDPPGGIVQLNNPVNLMVISTTRSDPGPRPTPIRTSCPRRANWVHCRTATFGTVVRTTNSRRIRDDGMVQPALQLDGSSSIQQKCGRACR